MTESAEEILFRDVHIVQANLESLSVSNYDANRIYGRLENYINEDNRVDLVVTEILNAISAPLNITAVHSSSKKDSSHGSWPTVVVDGPNGSDETPIMISESPICESNYNNNTDSALPIAVPLPTRDEVLSAEARQIWDIIPQVSLEEIRLCLEIHEHVPNRIDFVVDMYVASTTPMNREPAAGCSYDHPLHERSREESDADTVKELAIKRIIAEINDFAERRLPPGGPITVTERVELEHDPATKHNEILAQVVDTDLGLPLASPTQADEQIPTLPILLPAEVGQLRENGRVQTGTLLTDAPEVLGLTLSLSNKPSAAEGVAPFMLVTDYQASVNNRSATQGTAPINFPELAAINTATTHGVAPFQLTAAYKMSVNNGSPARSVAPTEFAEVVATSRALMINSAAADCVGPFQLAATCQAFASKGSAAQSIAPTTLAEMLVDPSEASAVGSEAASRVGPFRLATVYQASIKDGSAAQSIAPTKFAEVLMAPPEAAVINSVVPHRIAPFRLAAAYCRASVNNGSAAQASAATNFAEVLSNDEVPAAATQQLRVPALAGFPQRANELPLPAVPLRHHGPNLTNVVVETDILPGVAQQGYVDPAKRLHTIWQGVVEWQEMVKNPISSERQRRDWHLPCHVGCKAPDGGLKGDTWPQKLTMQMIPAVVFTFVGTAHLKGSRSVVFSFEPCGPVKDLTSRMSSGYAGCVNLLKPSTACDIKMIILLYSSKKRAFTGFIPNDQRGFLALLTQYVEFREIRQLIRERHQQLIPVPMQANTSTLKRKISEADGLVVVYEKKAKQTQLNEGSAAGARHKYLKTICEMFPAVEVAYLQRRCEELQPGDDISVLISALLDTPNMPQKPPSEPVEEEPMSPNQLMASYQALQDILPDADPDYLRETWEKVGRNQEDLKQFVIDSLERRNYPKLVDYQKRQKMAALQKKFQEEFNLEEFLEMFPDPFKHFEDLQNNGKPTHTAVEGRSFLMARYPKIRCSEIDRLYRKSDYRLLESCKALDNISSGLMKSTRKAFEIPVYKASKDLAFLQEIAFIENEGKIRQYLKDKENIKKIKFEEAKAKGELLQCGCCFDDEILEEDTGACNDGHVFCKPCINSAAAIEIGKGNNDLKCLAGCSQLISLRTLKGILKASVFTRLDQRKQLEEVKAAGIEDLETCPFCDFATIPPAEDKVFRCLNPDCMQDSCRLCKNLSHIPLRCNEVEKCEEVKLRTYIEDRMTEALVRTCYNCKKKFIKEDGCNKMTCTCGALMCYLCRQPVVGYTHFNGQGGDAIEKCPLYSTNEQLHVEAVRVEAKRAKEEVKARNPQVVLIHDPTMILPVATPRRT